MIEKKTPIYAHEALTNIINSCKVIVETEIVGLDQALNRVLAEDLIASINVPNFDNSAMDGYAICFNDINHKTDNTFTIIGKSFAGHPFNKKLNQGEAVRIMTGASIPEGANVVVMQELVDILDNNLISINQECNSKLHPQKNIRPAGDDIKIGDKFLSIGHRLSAVDLGLISSLGINKIAVYKKLKIAIFSTGDELVKSDGARQLQYGQIYDSNRIVIINLISQLGMECIDYGIIADEPELLEKTLISAAKSADVVITTGGVSVGEADYIRELLAKHGEISFWKIEIRPGRPMAFGKLNKVSENCYFFGLPGNPVSAVVSFLEFAKIGLVKLSGCKKLTENINFFAQITHPIKPQSKISADGLGRRQYIRANITMSEGRLLVTSLENQSSGVLRSLSLANGLIILPEDFNGCETGAMVEVQSFVQLINS